MDSHIYRISYVLFMFFITVLNFSHHTLSRTAIKFVPGYKGELPFEFETGYVGVDKSEDVQLFYYFVKSESNPKKDPLVLWLTGGPGCSSFSGLAFEIGPLKFDTEKNMEEFPTLQLNPYSWTKVANIIFLDLPVGTGFSYGRTLVASRSSDLQTCYQAYEFLKKWLIDHSEFLSNPVYIGGDSFSGLTVPIITQLISNGIDTFSEPFINLKGYLLGNPLTRLADRNYRIPFAHGMGLISDELYESLQRNCRGEYYNIDPSNTLCLQDFDTYTEITSGIDIAHILTPSCEYYPTIALNKRSVREDIIALIDRKESPCPDTREIGYKLSSVWLNEYSVRKVLGVRERTVTKWARCDHDVPYIITDMDAYPYHVNLSSKGYRSLIYSGDHDMMIPFFATQAWIRSLNYSIVSDWRQWLVQGQVAGYTRSYANNMTFATVKGGGHTAPEYKPRECFAMFNRWISNKLL